MTDPILSSDATESIKKFHKWKVGQINIQSCSDDHRLHTTLKECQRANLDVICLQEVRQCKVGSIKYAGYTLYWKGMDRYKKYGVGIAIRRNSDIVLNGITYTSSRLIAADLTVRGCKIRIISSYAPTRDNPLAAKELFYRNLSNLCKVDQHRKIIILGDFNAEPEFCRTFSRYDGRSSRFEEGVDLTDQNIMLFLQFCQKQKLSILNTWFEHPIHHRVTWHHPNGNCTKVYDYVLSEPWLRQYVTDVRVRNSYFNSDHRLVVAKLSTPANKAARFFKRKQRCKKPDIQMLQNDSVKADVLKAVQDHLCNNRIENDSINEKHDQIVQAFKQGRNILPAQPKSNCPTPWNQHPRLNELHEHRIKLRQQPNNQETKVKIKQVSKQIKTTAKEIQNEIWQKKAS